MFKSFPLFLLKKGLEIKLVLDDDCTLTSVNPTLKVFAANDDTHKVTTLTGLTTIAGTSYYSMQDGLCLINKTVPDEQHLKTVLAQLMNQELTFPYYTWSLPSFVMATQTMSQDMSYSGSRIDRTYFTFINQSTAAN